MNRKKYITFTLMLSLLCINKTYAACTQEEINEFKKVEDEYKITYEFNTTTKDYMITLHNPLVESYAYSFNSQLNSLKYYSGDEEKSTYSGMKPGKYEVNIVGITDGCRDVMKKITLSLSSYNAYSEDDLCQGIEEFVLCQPTYDKEIDYETFVSRVNTYKKTKQNKEENKNNDEQNVDNEIINYINNNLSSIVVVSVFVILVIITIVVSIKSIKKSRRLE